MKQGTGKTTYEPKTQPVSHKVNPGAVANMGNMVGKAQAVQSLYQGRGVAAPEPKCTTYKKGSQNG